MESRVKELLKNTGLFTISSMGAKLLVFLMVPLYTAVLSTENYGIANIIQTTCSLLVPILTMQISESVLRYCLLDANSKNNVLNIGLKYITFGLICCICLTLVFCKIPYFSSVGSYIWFIPCLYITNSFAQLFHKYSRGVNKVKISAIAGFVSTLVTICCNIVFLLLLKLNVFGYLLSFILGELSAVIIMVVFNDHALHSLRNINSNQILQKQMLHYSIPLIPNSISWWALSSFNQYAILLYLGIASVGIYSATLRIPTILTVLCDIFAQAWLLSALKDYGSEESKRFIKSMHSNFFAIAIILTSAIILLSEPIALMLLSGEFSSYWRIIPYLLISIFYGALVGFVGTIFSAECKNSTQFVSTMIGAIISVIITVLFIKTYGVIVVAIATLVGYYTIWLVRMIKVNKFIIFKENIFYSTFQGLILLIESILVGYKLYYLAILCLILLIIINIKVLSKVMRSCTRTFLAYSKNRKNVKLAIRDDDMNFFTKVEDIEYVYRNFNNFPISFAVIPKVKDVSTKGACSDTKGNTIPRDISSNTKLLQWLKQRIESGYADVLLHGETHEYKFINGRRYAEMEWRENDVNLSNNIKRNRLLLEQAIGHPVNCFVAPSNKIAKKCIKAVANNNLNFSGIIDLKFSRTFTLRNFTNYVRRWLFRTTSHFQYPGIMRYSDHKEINACGLRTYEYLVMIYTYCEEKQLPMVINVHYWDLRDNPDKLEMLRKFVMDYAMPRGAIPSTVSEILNS